MVLLQSYEQELPSSSRIAIQRIVTTMFYLTMVLLYVTYSFGVSRPTIPAIQDVSSQHFTAMTPNSVMTFDVYVGLMFVLQAQYLAKLMATTNEALLIAVTTGVSYHFVVYCILQSLLIIAWTREQFWVVEVILVTNLINVGFLYIRLGPTPHRTSGQKNINVQIPLSKMPSALILM